MKWKKLNTAKYPYYLKQFTDSVSLYQNTNDILHRTNENTTKVHMKLQNIGQQNFDYNNKKQETLLAFKVY